MRRWRTGIGIGVLIAAVGGCQEPSRFVPVGAPGTEYVPPVPASDGVPEALGETGSKGKAVTKAVDPGIPPAPPTAKGETATTASGVTYETLKEGTGPSAEAGQTVRVQYVGTLDDGTKFDSSRERDQPFSFVIGSGGVIRGWEEGVPGMKVGELRRLTVPAAAGYGEAGREPKIPGGATLHFDIELVGID